jgi:hypothetical protein
MILSGYPNLETLRRESAPRKADPAAAKAARLLAGPGCRVGLAVLIHERPQYLGPCLESLFAAETGGHSVTVVLHDDGSSDPRVREEMERPRRTSIRVVRHFREKGGNSWGAAFNSAMAVLLGCGDFDVVGSCDSDCLFNSRWLIETLRTCLWARANHREHALGPFSSFNSSDFRFHRILGRYESPHGRYLVKARMGALNYLMLREDLDALGLYEDSPNDETIMTEVMEERLLRYFCTEESWVEHLGNESVLNTWRAVPAAKAVYALKRPGSGWPGPSHPAGHPGPVAAAACHRRYERHIRGLERYLRARGARQVLLYAADVFRSVCAKVPGGARRIGLRLRGRR